MHLLVQTRRLLRLCRSLHVYSIKSCLNDKTVMTSPILSKISEIKEHARSRGFLENNDWTCLHDYSYGLNDLRKKIYISAEIRPDSLDKGFDITDESREYVQRTGSSGDQPIQYICKNLGGVGHPINVFPMNPQVDISDWKAAQDRIYSYLKQGGDRCARLLYGMEINCFFEDEISRPYKIYYHFQLFENGQPVEQAFEGTITNTSTKMTKEDYCRMNGRSYPYPRREGFKFVPYTFGTDPELKRILKSLKRK